jgi:hypothetical protein
MVTALARRSAVVTLTSLALLAVAGCATLGGQEESRPLTLAETAEETHADVAFDAIEGVASYQWQKTPQTAEWVACRANAKRQSGPSRGLIAVVHGDRAGFDRQKFCATWQAQSLLAQRFIVLMVNRPGYGASSGTPDFCGKQSLAAWAAGAADAVKRIDPKGKVIGAWGYDTGATCAALLSRDAAFKGMKFLAMGGGVYDYEETLAKTKDSYLRKDIEQIKKTGGDAAIEERSVSYDVSGLPPVLAVYHGNQDVAAPVAQAKAFVDSLESSGEYKVIYQKVDGVGHDIPPGFHRKILDVLMVSVVSQAGL